MTTYHYSNSGQKFYIEPVMNFADDGSMYVKGDKVFAGLVVIERNGVECELSGTIFDSRTKALEAIRAA